jgi:hypothetical protein
VLQLFPHARAHIAPGHVVDGENSHGHAPIGQRLVDLFGRRTVLDEKLRLVHVREHHPVAHEPRPVADDDPDLLQLLAEAERGGDDLRFGGFATHDFEQPHDVCRTEEVQSRDAALSRRDGRNLVDIERGRVRGENSARFREAVDARKDRLLQRHLLEDGFDDQVRVFQTADEPGNDPRHPLFDLRPGKASTGDGRIVVPPHRGDPGVERLRRGVIQHHRQPRICARHRNAAPHRPSTDDADLLNRRA